MHFQRTTLGRAAGTSNRTRSKTSLLIWAAAGFSLALMACGSNLAFLAERSRTEAQALQEDCHAAGLTSGYVSIADTLLTQSNQHWKEGDPLPAQQKSERAAAYYRLAMAETEAVGAKERLDSLHAARVKEEERLAAYQEFLNEARALRKP